METITDEQTHQANKKMFRKKYQAQFAKIFSAVLEIPNENLRTRIMAAVNEFDSSPAATKTFASKDVQTVISGNVNSAVVKCSCGSKETQTVAAHQIIGSKSGGGVQVKIEGDPQNIYTKSIIRQLDRSTQTTSSDLIEIREHKSSVRSIEKQSSKIISGKEVKLGRAKRVNIPHVKNDQHTVHSNSLSKSSRIISTPKSTTKKYGNQKLVPRIVEENRKEIQASPTPSDPFEVEQILNSNLDFDRIVQSNSVQIPTYTNHQCMNEIKRDMAHCLDMDEDGYLPIHRAIQENDELVIERQCKILTLRCKTIEFLTDENSETPLHIAIKNDSPVEIVKMLLNYKSNILEKNDDGNNALHLCVLHCTNVEILKLLISQITIDKLGVFNYDGMSVLHLTVLENKFLFTKTIIDYIDSALDIPHFVTCDSETQLYSKLQDYICTFTSEVKPKIDFNVRKMDILNQKNMKSGRTPLFLAVSLTNENISFLLMAHGADPRIEDFSGTDCNELSNHVIGNKLISTAVYNSTYYLDSNEAEQTRKRYEASKLKLMKKDEEQAKDVRKLPTLLGTRNGNNSNSRSNSSTPSPTRSTKRTYPSANNKKLPTKIRIIEKL